MQRLLSPFREALDAWNRVHAPRLAAAMAYYAILALPPLLLAILSLAGLLVERSAAQQQLIDTARRLAGPQAAQVVGQVLANAQQPSGGWLPTALGLLLLLYSASAIFGQLQDALNTVWDVRAPRVGLERALLSRGLAFVMVLAVGLLFMLLLLATTALSWLNQVLPITLRDNLVLAHLGDFLGTLVVATVGFALIFKLVPDVAMAWRHVLLGALVTAALFALGKFALSLYLRRTDPTSTYGAAGSLILLLIWLYYSAQVFFLGAELTQVWARRSGMPIRPRRGAVSLLAEEAPPAPPIAAQAPVVATSAAPRTASGPGRLPVFLGLLSALLAAACLVERWTRRIGRDERP